MVVAKIRLFPEPVLRKKALPVKVFNVSLKSTVHLMSETMRAQPSGIGIAAPQIGISYQIAVVDVSSRVPGAERLVLINPKIVRMERERASREGCMSLPDYSAYLKRYDWICFSWQDIEGNRHERSSIGIEAICIQHEIDHLNGILFIDRVACLKTDAIPMRRQRSVPTRA